MLYLDDGESLNKEHSIINFLY